MSNALTEQIPAVILTQEEASALRATSTLTGVEGINGVVGLFDSIQPVIDTEPLVFNLSAEFSKTGRALAELALAKEFDYILGLSTNNMTSQALMRLHDHIHGPDVHISLLSKFIAVTEYGVDQPTNKGAF